MTTEREKLKKAIEVLESVITVSGVEVQSVLSAAKAHLETMPEQDPLDWMEEGQMVEVWDDGWDKEHKDIRKTSRVNSRYRGIFAMDGFDTGESHYNNWRLPEARAIKHNGNGQNPCPGENVIRRFDGWIREACNSNTLDWTIPCEFILPEGW